MGSPFSFFLFCFFFFGFDRNLAIRSRMRGKVFRKKTSDSRSRRSREYLWSSGGDFGKFWISDHRRRQPEIRGTTAIDWNLHRILGNPESDEGWHFRERTSEGGERKGEKVEIKKKEKQKGFIHDENDDVLAFEI